MKFWYCNWYWKGSLWKIKDLNLDFAYIALHGVFGEDGRIQAILQSFGIAYSGPGVMSSAVCMDKEFSKELFLNTELELQNGKVFV